MPNRSGINDIKPCPFCGNDDPYWDAIDIDGEDQHFLMCQACGCQGPYAQEIAIAAGLWNTRPQP